MRQQVNVNIDLVYDVDASLTREQLLNLIAVDVGRLENFDATLTPVEYMGCMITNLIEEAEIYGNVA